MSLIFPMAKISDYARFILPGPDKWNQKVVNSQLLWRQSSNRSAGASPKAKAWMKHTYAEEVVAFYTPFKPQHTYLTFSTAAQMEGHKHRVELHTPWPTLHNS